MPIAAAIGGGAMLGGAVLQSQSAKKAKKAQIAAQQQAQKTQSDNLTAIMGTLKPYTDIGTSALSSLQAMIGPAGPNTAEMYRQLEQYPGYQFAMGQGTNALNAEMAKAGSTMSGNQVAGALEYQTGMGSQLFDKYFGHLMDVAGLGQDAVGKEIAARQTATNNISSSQVAAGDAYAQGSLANGQIWSSFLNNASKLAGNVAGADPSSWLNQPVSSLWSGGGGVGNSGGIMPGMGHGGGG